MCIRDSCHAPQHSFLRTTVLITSFPHRSTTELSPPPGKPNGQPPDGARGQQSLPRDTTGRFPPCSPLCFQPDLYVSAQSIRFLAITQTAVLFPSGEGRRPRDVLLVSSPTKPSADRRREIPSRPARAAPLRPATKTETRCLCFRGNKPGRVLSHALPGAPELTDLGRAPASQTVHPSRYG